MSRTLRDRAITLMKNGRTRMRELFVAEGATLQRQATATAAVDAPESSHR